MYEQSQDLPLYSESGRMRMESNSYRILKFFMSEK